MSNKNKEDLIKKYNFSSEYIKDYKKFKSEIINKKIIPYQVEFQPPPRGKKICWLECPYCYGKSAENNQERLDKEKAKNILNEILDGGVKKIIFAGSATDPLNCEYIDDLLDITVSKKAIFGFNTKALKISDKFFKILKNNQLQASSYISLSIDAGSNETYNNIHDVKAPKAKIYNQVLENAKRLGEIKSNNHFDLSAAYLVNIKSAKLSDYENFINDFLNAGCNVLRFSFPQPPKDIDTEKGVIPSKEEIKNYINDIKKLQKKYQNNDSLILIANPDIENNIYNKARTLPCFARYLFPTVGYDGWLYNCSQSSAPNFRKTALGNLNKDSFWKLFYNYENEKIENFVQNCSIALTESGCRCDRKEHLLNQQVKSTKVFSFEK